jgi:hypothetical protein
MVSVLDIGPEVRGFKPDRGRLIFKGDKIRSRRSFGGEVKPSASCRKIPAEYDRDTTSAKFKDSSRQLPACLLAQFLPTYM